jgi:dinuclear metal center YbgI/SA1388 family protein
VQENIVLEIHNGAKRFLQKKCTHKPLTCTFFYLFMITVKVICDILEAWAPKGAALTPERFGGFEDNVGLQIGDSQKEVKNILVALDVTREVIREAVTRQIDLLIVHHPLLFRPLKTIRVSDSVGKLVYELVQHDIALYVAHTNLDLTKGGVSVALAKALGLQKIDFLRRCNGLLKKIAVFVPVEYVDRVTEAMARGGAGIIGNYELCSFRTAGTGTFKPMVGATPFLGSACGIGEFEKAEEIRLEMLAPAWAVNNVIQEMKRVHPYEEVAYDVYPVEQDDVNYGYGAIGSLPEPTTLREYIAVVKETLKVSALRYAGDVSASVQTIAVCGGSGSFLLGDAIQRRADVFITADVRYHTFHDAVGRIALIDAGHYETEQFIIPEICAMLQQRLDTQNVAVHATTIVTNPMNIV